MVRKEQTRKWEEEAWESKTMRDKKED